MSIIDLIPILEKINFIGRYIKICKAYGDLDNRVRMVDLDEINLLLNKMDYNYTYYSGEELYKIKHDIGSHSFILQFVFKNGIVETFVNIKLNDKYYFPNGRLDFIPKKMGKEFDRKKYNLPKFTSYKDLGEILVGIFSIFEDIKHEVIGDFSL